jgi:hypothetical protein
MVWDTSGLSKSGGNARAGWWQPGLTKLGPHELALLEKGAGCSGHTARGPNAKT